MFQNSSKRYYLYTFILFWCALVVVSSVYVVTPLTDTFSSYFQVSEQETTWIGSVFSGCYAIGFLLFVPLVESFGKRQLIVFGLVMLTWLTFLLAFAEAFWFMLMFRALQGFFAATFAPTALAYVFDLFPKDKRMVAISYISFGYVLAGIFGQAVADIINQTFEWQLVFYVFSVIYLISIFLVYCFLPSTTQTVRQLKVKSYILQIKQLIIRRELQVCYFIAFTLLFTFLGMYSLMGDYLQGNPYYLLDREVFNVRVLGITGMLLSPFAGFFVKRWGELIVLRFSLSIALIGLFFMVISNNLWFTISASVGYVAGISLTFPVLMKIIGDLGGEARSVASALYAFILFVGASLGPMTSLYFKGIAGYHGALLSLASCLFISCWVAFLSKLLREKSDASFSEST
ncbi:MULTISPECIES: MFS transporter [Virgibacillus]|uniref:MFS transporter n=2 Tax=Virgibacillus TaxID=84406 RepID=A0ABQ2DQ72_9BACI|nr:MULTISPECIES: MFS transporter [Virgibacillus]EQB38909.1 hypothetical protein M948_00770 [Virgibacillus sp. CM-4]GGJ67065.1 MFS transporter [Virgibacillus kapii]